jgi:enamine deaminase RidA (YjgF/YER057c/UK114 family)
VTRTRIAGISPYEATVGFSRAMRVGNAIFVAGTAPIWPDGTCDSSPFVQARRCWEIALEALAKAGGAARHVVRTRQFIMRADMQDEVGRAHGEVFADIRPVSTMVVVAGLLDPRWVVEVELDAIIDD